MITSLYINGFKSLRPFYIHSLHNLVILIGKDEEIKNQILESLDFLRAISQGKVKDWFTRNNQNSSLIGWGEGCFDFVITFSFEKHKNIKWEGIYNFQKDICTEERLSVGGESLFSFDTRIASLTKKGMQIEISHWLKTIKYSGSLLQIIKSEEADKVLDFMSGEKTRGSCFIVTESFGEKTNPDEMKKVVSKIIKDKDQNFGNVYNPLFLNYLSDEEATNSVFLVYPNNVGQTKVTPFYTIPSIKEKMTVMGPGEVFVDTDLNKLIGERDDT